jgi:hypothetical protein
LQAEIRDFDPVPRATFDANTGELKLDGVVVAGRLKFMMDYAVAKFARVRFNGVGQPPDWLPLDPPPIDDENVRLYVRVPVMTNEGILFSLFSASIAVVGVIKALLKECRAEVPYHRGMSPVIEYSGSSSYFAKKAHGHKFKPRFQLVSWAIRPDVFHDPWLMLPAANPDARALPPSSKDLTGDEIPF